jgi:hypothetical protein
MDSPHSKDVISYRVESIQPALKLKQVGLATGMRWPSHPKCLGIADWSFLGYKCGATFVDRHFLSWLEEKLGDELYEEIFPSRVEHQDNFQRIVDKDIRDVMRDFEQMRRKFDGTLPRERRGIRLWGRFADWHSPERGIENGMIVVTK